GAGGQEVLHSNAFTLRGVCSQTCTSACPLWAITDITGGSGIHVIHQSVCENECRSGGRTANRAAARSSGIVTFDPIGRRAHPFAGAFPQLFGRLLQPGQTLGGELYQGGGARKF